MIKLNNIPITIGAFYSLPRHIIPNIIFTDYFNTIKNNFIIGGDFTTKLNSWGCCDNPRGTVLYIIKIKNFIIFSTPKPTNRLSYHRKKLDILYIFITKIPSN